MTRTITAGTEVVSNYNCTPWFACAEAPKSAPKPKASRKSRGKPKKTEDEEEMSDGPGLGEKKSPAPDKSGDPPQLQDTPGHLQAKDPAPLHDAPGPPQAEGNVLSEDEEIFPSSPAKEPELMQEALPKAKVKSKSRSIPAGQAKSKSKPKPKAKNKRKHEEVDISDSDDNATPTMPAVVGSGSPTSVVDSEDMEADSACD